MVDEKELRELASNWQKMAMEQVPDAYASRGLHSKYLKLDNYAAGMDDCAIELLELLDRAAELQRAPAEAGGGCTCISFGPDTTHPGVIMGDCPVHGTPRLGG